MTAANKFHQLKLKVQDFKDQVQLDVDAMMEVGTGKDAST